MIRNRSGIAGVLLLAGGLAAGFAGTASAQDNAKPKDAQAAFEPPSGPGAGQAYLKTFEGDWDVDKVFYRPTGEAIHTPGECHQAMVKGGLFLESDFTFHQKDGTTGTGTGISGFDPKTGLFMTFWYDSRSPHFSIRASREPFDGKHIELHSVSVGASWGSEHDSRTETHLEDNGHKLIHRQFVKDKDGKERVMSELLMTRKGGAAAPGK